MVAETTCLGAAYAAGLAVGFWPDTDALRANWRRAAEWTPRMDADDARPRVQELAQGRRADHGLDRARGELRHEHPAERPGPRDAPGCRLQPGRAETRDQLVQGARTTSW